MRYLSVCSGIEAATQAWHPLGWEPLAFSEIERFPSEVLAHHYPDVPNLGDMTRYKEWDLDPADVDLLVGGTPCQSFSVAGLRKGLDDPRGNLALTYLGIADRFRPDWIVWENVPGVLSSNGGRDFGAFLGGLAELGYGFAYRVLDAQYVRVESHPRAVPQRRRRVFVVGHLGDWRRAAAVLFERESLSGHSAPRRESGKGVAGDVAGCLRSGGDRGVPSSRGERIVADIATSHTAAHSLLAKGNSSHRLDAESYVAEVGPAMGASSPPYSRTGNERVETEALVTVMSSGQANAEITHDLAPTLNTNRYGAPIAFDTTQITSKANYSRPKPGDPCHPLAAGAHPPTVAFSSNMSEPDRAEDGTSPTVKPGGQGGNPPAVAHTLRANPRNNSDPASEARMHIYEGMAVRRLTPVECERLQGFPDDFTRIPWISRHANDCAIYDESDLSECDCDREPLPAEECPDGHRYKALGNSMAVNCMRWLGERIQMVDQIRSTPP